MQRCVGHPVPSRWKGPDAGAGFSGAWMRAGYPAAGGGSGAASPESLQMLESIMYEFQVAYRKGGVGVRYHWPKKQGVEKFQPLAPLRVLDGVDIGLQSTLGKAHFLQLFGPGRSIVRVE